MIAIVTDQKPIIDLDDKTYSTFQCFLLKILEVNGNNVMLREYEFIYKCREGKRGGDVDLFLDRRIRFENLNVGFKNLAVTTFEFLFVSVECEKAKDLVIELFTNLPIPPHPDFYQRTMSIAGLTQLQGCTCQIEHSKSAFWTPLHRFSMFPVACPRAPFWVHFFSLFILMIYVVFLSFSI